jgi:uncharacterized protein (DUF488 family)
MSSSFASRHSLSDHRPVSGRIYSVGYEGFEVETLIDHLASSKVSLVIDVRLTPMSRRRGFSRKSLSAELQDAGIDYTHEPDLGNPPDNRDSFRRGDGEEGRRRMREMLDNGSGPALRRLIEHASGARVAVLCVERDRLRCHRHVITEMVQELDPTIEVLQIL